jgi:hypothetical protein
MPQFLGHRVKADRSAVIQRLEPGGTVGLPENSGPDPLPRPDELAGCGPGLFPGVRVRHRNEEASTDSNTVQKVPQIGERPVGRDVGRREQHLSGEVLPVL